MAKKFSSKASHRSAGSVGSRATGGSQDPLRSELYGVEQMRHHGKILAASHELGRARPPRDGLLTRLVENEAALKEAKAVLNRSASANGRIQPAAEWLLDNFYLIEENIGTSKRDLPKGYSRGLPKLIAGSSAGLPRVYDIALERISHGDGLVDTDTLPDFLDAYQSVSALTLGELWAVPIMLRLALIENVRRVAVQITAEMRSQGEADGWADRMTASLGSDPKSLILIIAEMAKSNPPMDGPFVAEFARKLQGKGPELALPIGWIEQKLAETGLTIDRLIQAAMRQQSAAQVSISNSIRGLRSLGSMDLKKLVEGASLVERILRRDPSGSYGNMDFSTRDSYRHAIEKLAKRGGISEESAAEASIRLAREGLDRFGKDDRRAHVGYYLIDKGIASLLKEERIKSTFRDRSMANGRSIPFWAYLALIATPAIGGTALLMALAYLGASNSRSLFLFFVPCLLAAVGVSVTLVHSLATFFTEPRVLPRMDFTGGVPDHATTLVVIPSMLAGASHIEALADALEVRFLGNRDPNIMFGLLTDFLDGGRQTDPGDSALTAMATEKIAGLNEKYSAQGYHPFYLFHRPRRWNASERIWMGYERKRGKLADLNSLLRGGEKTAFETIAGDVGRLGAVKYVITLDTDTQLPRGCARELTGIMAHPLNRVQFNDSKTKIEEGYSIIQPRITITVRGTRRSLYAMINNHDPGFDPYSSAVSDAYQDLFREGSYTGKGIYDIDGFEASLKGRFPENRILSHDLIEGCFARSAFASDLLFYEDTPSAYLDDMDRRKRWTRGDWQIAPWLCKTVPGVKGGFQKNTLSPLSKWKILDNLRRSLQAPSILSLFFLGWIFIGDPLIWTSAVAGLIFAPALISLAVGTLSAARKSGFLYRIGDLAGSTLVHLAQAGLSAACLPYEAMASVVAIAQTAWRSGMSHRRLLLWRPFGDTGGADRSSLRSTLWAMWMGPACAISAIALMTARAPAALPLAIAPAAIWLASPFLMWLLSLDRSGGKEELDLGQRRYLGSLARKTWDYFETFVNAGENWLPPDNLQEIPADKIAHRTSPTNIGLSLLANLTAYDLGYIPAGALLARTERSFTAIKKLERLNSHLFNWYDTQTLKPLQPRYVSAVDSGNFTAHLITLGAGVDSIPDEKILSPRFWEGLLDVERILSSYIEGEEPPALSRLRREAMGASQIGDMSLSSAYESLKRLLSDAEKASDHCARTEDNLAARWSNALASQIHGAIDELEILAPWLAEGCDLRDAAGASYLSSVPSLKDLRAIESRWLGATAGEESGVLSIPPASNRMASRYLVKAALAKAESRTALIRRIAADAEGLGYADYAFLYSEKRKLLSIGYDAEGKRRDRGHYDLLASEARLASFVAIALGQIPQDNWFALGRLLVAKKGEPLLFSWSGSMFEYLMPLLVMPSYERTLLDQTCREAVERQIAYGAMRNIPWGISESCYNSFDLGLNYRYKAFGVPGLGLKRGLLDDLVVAPYASALALMLSPSKACDNLRRLSAEGAEGAYGHYEAVDYTRQRVPSGAKRVVVRSFMAHHQAMSLIAVASTLLGRPMQRRFGSSPLFRSAMLLLEEKTPRLSRPAATATETLDDRAISGSVGPSTRVFHDTDAPIPAVQLLSNGKYHAMVNVSGSGYSRWNEISITRWTEDRIANDKGSFLYIKDIKTGDFWSNTYQPTLKQPDSYEAIFSEGRAEFRRHDRGLITYTEISVSPEDDIELRRVRIENRSKSQRTLELTSYAEVVLTTDAEDAAHPGFSNLFVQTEILEDRQAILCSRRRGAEEDRSLWMLHLMNIRSAVVTETSYETNRLNFIGRCNSAADPAAMRKAGPLSGCAGSVLDPIVAIRQRVSIGPESTAVIDIITGIGLSKEGSVRLVDRYRDKHFTNRTFELARTHSQVILQQINATEKEAILYNRLAAAIMYPQAGLRADPAVIASNLRGQSSLWGYSISGDLPILLLTISNSDNIGIIRQLVQAHAYLRQKGLASDLVIWNEERGGYQQELHNLILGLASAVSQSKIIDRTGGIFVRYAGQISPEDRVLMQSAARVIISDASGPLERQIEGRLSPNPMMTKVARRIGAPSYRAPAPEPARELLFKNGYGGFSKDGKEYVIAMDDGGATPAPWANVLANESFGSVVSEAGMAYTWSENAHEFRLTPWHDDPVCDSSGEALYIRDEDSGRFWSPTRLPRAPEGSYICRHGFGYSSYEHERRGIKAELTVFVAKDDAVKISILKISNKSGRNRRLSATAYAQFVLGESPKKSAMHVVTGLDETTGALFARNRYSAEFSSRVAFMDAPGNRWTCTADRSEFIGYDGNASCPRSMSNTRLSGRTGAALDPCGAVQVPCTLEDGETREIVFILGSGRDAEEAVATIQKYRAPGAARRELDSVKRSWETRLRAVQVDTPDAALNVLANGWLVYQAHASRLWGRAGYYQSGGAFGFRDQLQDAMGLVQVDPELLRAQLILCAGRQFPEGDVQHWWHPPGGRGARTRCSDDFLWLPMAACRYIESTGDTELLSSPVRYIEGRPIGPGDESYTDLPDRSDASETLYEHCVRAIKNGAGRGRHGLPLIGSGDWNDGMNKVGAGGEGESVWLAFFLFDVLSRFGVIAAARGDADFADYCLSEGRKLSTAIDQHAWDGAWYLRAYFDDGKPLGSAGNAECRIDSIAQSWSALSGAGDPARSRQAMDSVYERLVNHEDGLIQLLDPPFDTELPVPGYIQAYVKGVRENGGQYTHAAVWAIMAFAKLGDVDRAWELLSMINPINHALSHDAAARYAVEPYVVAADVYSYPPHSGRGGWTWYTGSAAWMYRLIIEDFLGLRLEAGNLLVAPSIPSGWNGFKAGYTYKKTLYNIVVTVQDIEGGAALPALLLDGTRQPGNRVPLRDDLAEHQIDVLIKRRGLI